MAVPNEGGQVSVVNLFEVAEHKSESSFDLDRLIEEFRNQRTIDWSIPEAFLCLLLSAAAADGKLSPEEQAEIEALSRRSRALKKISADEMARLNTVVSQRMKARPDGLREACESLPTNMRLPMFAHCVDIVLADGVLLPIEMAFLNQIIGLLGIDPAEGKRVMEVLLIKNRF
jgi:uncharacterized tellurite resistance protein B-like protein